MRTRFHVRQLNICFVAACIFAMAVRHVSAAYTLSTVVTFNGTNGNDPVGNLTLFGGKLYGVTVFGGSTYSANKNQGAGTIFSIEVVDGILTTVTSFTGSTTDGGNPQAGLTLGSDGNLYGTTAGGGISDSGVIYKLAPLTNSLNILPVFNNAKPNSTGQNPYCNVLRDAAGNLYGTTTGGGPESDGVVFKLDTNNAFSTLVNFNNTTNGITPNGGLVADSKGNLYGSTSGGVTDSGFGTIYEIDAATNKLTNLVQFNQTNGWAPYDDLTIDAAGNLYGTTRYGGANNLGTVFKVDAVTHDLTTLATFDGSNGRNPYAALTMDANGDLFGTTQGNQYDSTNPTYGTVFRLDPTSGALTTLATFNGVDGSSPSGQLYLDSDGKIYGTTAAGGASDQGTVFELAAPEPASLTLFALGCIGQLAWRRRSAKKGCTK